MKMNVSFGLAAAAAVAGFACGGATGTGPATASVPASASAPAPASASASASASAPASASTIDPRIQSIAGEELDRAVAEWHASRAVALVLDPATGAVLAMDGRAHGHAEPALAQTRAWRTGSTLKTLTVAAALEDHTITLDQRFPCAPRAYGARELHDAGPCPAALDVAGILAHSSNVGTSYVFDTLGPQGAARLTRVLHDFHVGDAPGAVPAIDDERGFHGAMFANGEVAEATPLQMAAAYGAVFNDGLYLAPVLSAVPGSAAGKGARVIRSDTARTLADLLERAITNPGHAQGARVPGSRVAGKTGTADFVGEGGAEMYYASFIGAVLDATPPFVALVGLEVPEGKATGPSAAAPMFGRVAARIVSLRASRPSTP